MAQQKIVLKISTMTNEKVRQKAMEAAADILGVDSIGADIDNQELTVIGDMDTSALMKKLKKVGEVTVASIGVVEEEKDAEKKI
ncbi:heavy metal-associated isoprenylated plant protein 39-like [Andrographis paniculata]|uniref:heavy metal-associated isoprenylated plant protein 39-like n=1 Tax=Andrographis paniculata TaxID=175694 RepID=UPI0021E8E455|nr:heavy metal-associated isoprenylated plant protein 39-like [Andrographis paniculata]